MPISPATRGLRCLTHIVDPVPPLAGLGLVVAGLAALSVAPRARRAPSSPAASPTLIAIVLKDQLKYAFGRLWPETWVDNNPS